MAAPPATLLCNQTLRVRSRAMAVQEMGSIEREIHVDASPEVVFDVVSKPEHVREWWSDEADFASEPGGTGFLAFGEDPGNREHVAGFTVVDVEPPHRFSF